MNSVLTPLPILLSHVLLAFEEQYAGAEPGLPPLALLANILRVLQRDEGVDVKTLPAAGRISSRAVRIATQQLARDGWLSINPVKRGLKMVSLTATGEQYKLAGMAGLTTAESAWRATFGTGHVAELRDSLTAIIRQVDLELPHFPSGYGQGDSSIQGGSHVPGTPGPPRVPAHGEEWPVVVRTDLDALATMPLSALLSQVLCAFTIDYDATAESELAGLHTVLSYLRYVSDDGMPLDEARKRGGVTGTGRSAFERHLLVTVESKVAYLTAHGRRVRDRYPNLVIATEEAWRNTYGDETVGRLRSVLEHFDERIATDVLDYPQVCAWLQRK